LVLGYISESGLRSVDSSENAQIVVGVAKEEAPEQQLYVAAEEVAVVVAKADVEKKSERRSSITPAMQAQFDQIAQLERLMMQQQPRCG
jgi:hypothetical protein